MRYLVEHGSLCSFPAWGNGLIVLNELANNKPKGFNLIEEYINEWCDNELVTATQINDFLWFSARDYLESCTPYNYETDSYEWGE